MSKFESRAVSAEDVLPDDQNAATVNGMAVRKGSVAAFIANAKLFESLAPSDPDYLAVQAQLRSLTPAVRAVGVFDVLQPRSTALAALIDERAQNV